MKFARICNPLKTNSFFMFGARATGKTSLIADFLKGRKHRTYDLLQRDVEDRLARDPELLFSEIEKAQPEWVFIDEIQKIPKLLDTVHRVLENRAFSSPCFALSGSSARKLKHGGANLLAGRAFVNNLYPLTHVELGEAFDLDSALNWGGLPKIYHFQSDKEREEYLRAYGLTYLNEEVWAEHLVEKLDPFRRFLDIAAQSNGQIVNYANVARDTGANEKTVKRYFQILEDTLLGLNLESYSGSVRKRQAKSPKFYFFDLGVTRSLAQTLRQNIVPNTYAYGRAFEHFIILETHRLSDYHRLDYRFSFLRTKDDLEIDLVIDRPGCPLALIEIKSKTQTAEKDGKALRSIRRDFGKTECFCLSNDQSNRTSDGISYLHWKYGLQELGLCPS